MNAAVTPGWTLIATEILPSIFLPLLVVMDKSERVANYARNLMREVGIIAHSCGVDDPRELRRRHCRVVVDDGLSRSLERLYPTPVQKV